MQSNWQNSFELLLDSEGGFVVDRGGATNLGVTQTTWEMYVERPATIDEMKSLTVDDVEPLYRRLFWDRMWCDRMPIGIDYLLFDMGVNAGVGQSVLLLQRAVGAHQDGGMGPLTFAATVTHDPVELINTFSQSKIDFYKSLHDSVNERGWLNRVAHVKAAALIMVNQSGQKS
jgi:lysozyme family protein